MKKKKFIKKFTKKSDKIKQIKKKKIENAKSELKDFPTLKIKKESAIAMDFAAKVYKKFNMLVKSIVLFGSTVKQNIVTGSDIDIIIIIDDSSVKWDQELIAWYREELDKIMRANPYQKSLHINTIKLSTWWNDLMQGDPVLLNILRYGESLVDMAGFFNPLKYLLLEGKIKPSPEAIYTSLKRAPMHLARSRQAELSSIEGLYWAMVDSAHAALIAENIMPPSPEHIPAELKINFVDSGKLKIKYVEWYRNILILHKQIAHGKIRDLKAVEIDDWQNKTEEFINTMANLVNDIVNK